MYQIEFPDIFPVTVSLEPIQARLDIHLTKSPPPRLPPSRIFGVRQPFSFASKPGATPLPGVG